MPSIDDIASALPIDQIAARLGVDADTARKAVDSALPALVGGLQRNAGDDGGAQSLASVIASKGSSLIDGGVSLDDVDETDGAKIVGHVFGGKSDDVAQALGAQGSSVDPSMLKKLLPMLAPVVMAYLAQQTGGKSGSPTGGGIQDILGSILGGGSGSKAKGGPDIGNILGSIFGSKG